MKNERFIVTHKEGSMFTSLRQILVDKQTGVNYLSWQSGNAGGITPLLDRDGKPVVTAVNNFEE